ncbi:MAG: methyltransferase domain-containing protein [Candidatus Diapherotrites archaeon]|nr:methyltransferase domain-containing protein [Candidatus Diapherotrites archaeon]
MKKFHWDVYFQKGGKDARNWREPDENVVEHVKLFKEEGIHSILDLGCGLGRNSVFLAKSGFSVTAADLSPTALEKTKKRRFPPVTLCAVMRAGSPLFIMFYFLSGSEWKRW